MPFTMRLFMVPLLLALMVPGLTGCQPASSGNYQQHVQDPERLHAAVKKLSDVMVHDIFSPPQASRAFAYTSLAAYEALQPAHSETRTLAGQLNGLTPVPSPPEAEYEPTLAAVHAFLKVAEEMVYSQQRIATHHEAMRARLDESGIPEGVLQRSLDYGDAVAQHILDWASQDNYKQTRSGPQYTVTDDSSRWEPTPPGYMDAVEPNWNQIRPFVMEAADQFKPTRPHPYSMDEGSPFYQEVMEVYEVGKNLTDEQREIAAFWDCNPYVVHTRGHVMYATKYMTPGAHWMLIGTIVARQTEASMMRAAEIYARLGVAVADGFISAFDEKYRSDLVRPETVINRSIDDSWRPLLQTPPFPEYTSAHSVVSAAAAETLTDLYGEPFAFRDTSEVEYGLPVRSFDSFREAAEEAAISRLYGGIHYRMAIENGVDQGTALGEYVVSQIETRPSAMASAEGQ
jgi:hypothetical protein